MKQIDLKDQYFGTEIEMTGISRYDAAVAIGRMFGIISVLTIPGV